jgi:hypothetical protein
VRKLIIYGNDEGGLRWATVESVHEESDPSLVAIIETGTAGAYLTAANLREMAAWMLARADEVSSS